MKKKLLTIMGMALMGIAPIMAQGVERPEAIMVGSYEVYALQESAHSGSVDILIDAPSKVLAKYAPEGTFPMATNAVLIRRGDKVWLVDTGYGNTIFDKMAALGIAPEDVDEVLLTHLHGDHIGGMFRGGVKAFPNAFVRLSKAEADYWKKSQNEAAAKIFAEYGDAVQRFSPTEIDAPTKEGITPIAAYGHTAGHTMFMITDGDEKLLIWGDLTHAMAVQMPNPKISVRYDGDPKKARKSRLKVLRYIAGSDISVVGMHIPTKKAGKVVKSGNGYKFVTE